MALQEWMQSTVKAFAALAGNRPHTAAALWLRAADEIARAPASEPLRAASHNNVGVAHLLMANLSDGAAHLVLAQQLWRQSQEDAGVLDVPIAGRSSVFHLRLAMQHQDAFSDLKRGRLVDLCDAAGAIARRNEQLARVEANDERGAVDADQSMIDVLATAFGPQCAEISLLREQRVATADAVSAAYRNKAERLARRAAHSYLGSAGYAGDIDRAAHLTALLHPSLLPKVAEIR